MARKRTLLLLIGYGFAATLAIFYGLVERHSLFVTFVSFHLAVCVAIPLLHGWWEKSLQEHWRLAWGLFEKRGALFGIGLGLLFFTGILTGLWLILQAEGRPDIVRAGLESWGVNRNWIGLFALYLVVVNSLLEELFWRGFVLQRMLRSLSRVVSVLLTSFFYTLYHLIITTALFGVWQGLLLTTAVYGAGVIWGWMKGLFPSIYPTWFSHLLADLGLALAVVFWIY
ncbi:CAAX amino terminal protease family [Brevibacillus sp. CF112]|uniref:CPBP family intramembrane glutamic endopeptidase n=1 Tax=Brevibacillus TaxID=55080 RepID=UPI000271A1B7|nr:MULTISPECIES: type II CAAX endopeptidase family protein [Brevibacillus]EJL46162.1 CAAX amino terminal protease family [Brevibacillus sp. CF112]MBG9564966.1 metallopeptidase [Brevibacillus agri]